MKAIIALIAAAALAGCDTLPADPLALNIVSDTFCQTAKKVSWSVSDTWQTIDEARRHNARIDRVCGVPGGKGKSAPATS